MKNMADALPMKPEYEYQTVEETADPEKDIHSTAHHNGEDRTKLKHPPMAEALPMQPEYEIQEIPETAHQEKYIQSERKRQRHAEMIQRQKEMRKRKKLERKERIREQGQDAGSEPSLSREEMRKRCEEGMKTGQIICIDCSLEQHMSDKEKGKLAMQVGRLYGSNRRVDNPAHIYLTGVNKGGQLYSELVKKNSGFENYLIEVEEKSHIELFPLERVVYLSPDSNNLLEDVDPGKIYVIGGLVDESVKKKQFQLDLTCKFDN
ncbi:TM10B-like protein [Mya arenaria]|uniref:TM10B-like protein n=1 Tax=Mya arenaria TaxID=6604 RepID=A0ABY7GA22_MYAAR|nr:TM10B-like protein [Mya arenaria]